MKKKGVSFGVLHVCHDICSELAECSRLLDPLQCKCRPHHHHHWNQNLSTSLGNSNRSVAIVSLLFVMQWMVGHRHRNVGRCFYWKIWLWTDRQYTISDNIKKIKWHVPVTGHCSNQTLRGKIFVAFLIVITVWTIDCTEPRNRTSRTSQDRWGREDRAGK